MKPDVIVVETLGSHGRVHTRDRVMLTAEKRSAIIGRAAEADVVLDDPYAAALHASVEVTPDGAIVATDLGTANGIVVDGRRHQGAQQLPVPNGLLQIGRTRLRIRSVNETLAPEKTDHAGIVPERGSPGWAAAVGALACAAYVVYLAWLDAPRDLAATIMVMFVPALLFSGPWIALWALLSRVMQGEWRWLWHGAILFTVAAAYVLLDNLLDATWFAYSLPRWESRETVMGAITFGVALYWHLTHASSVGRRRAALIAILLPAAVASCVIWIQVRLHDRDVNYIDANEKVYPPGLRVRGAGEVQAFFERASQLRADADAKRSAIPADDESDY